MEARIMNKSVQNQSIKRTKKLNYIGTLRNLIKAMKDHHSGLVELLKNSAFLGALRFSTGFIG